MKKLLALLLLLGNVVLAQQTAGTTGTLDPNQVYTTGNIVLPTVAGTNQTPWVNGVYQDQLTCWAWGNPGYCGPNAIVRPGNNINFSFGMTDLYQVQSIAGVLPTTGLRVNGYNFGFMAKNGNGWDGGGQDYLTAYVSFYGTDGKIKDYTNYNLNSKFDWTQFNYTKDFVTPYADKDLSTVRYGFVGMDNNYWAGPYGPEVYNVSFSLKYSVDPCAVNVLSSPTCPGYLDALAKLAPAPTTTTTDPITTASTSPTTTTTIVTDPVTSTVNVSSTTTIGQPTVVAPVVSAPSSTTSSTSTATASSSTTSSQTTKESSGGSSNTSLALSIISKNSERDAAGSAVAQSAVAQAQQAATQAQQEAASVASNAVSNSMTANAVTVGSQQSSGNGIRINNNSNSTNFTLQSGQTTMSTLTGLQSGQTMFVQQQGSGTTSVNVSTGQQVSVSNTSQQQSTNNTSTSVVSLLQPQQTTILAPTINTTTYEQQVQQPVTLQNNSTNTQTVETYALIPPNMLTDKSNPLTDIIEGKQNIPQNNTTTISGPVVNKNAQDNEIAGGVDINKMALAPTGYNSYLNFTLKDAAFYAPKEVYRNQVNVDNARALRLLTNDSKHQEMVEQQYRR